MSNFAANVETADDEVITDARRIDLKHRGCSVANCVLSDDYENDPPFLTNECMAADDARPFLRAIDHEKAKNAAMGGAVIDAISHDDWKAIINECGACGEAAQVQQDSTSMCERHDYLFAAINALARTEEVTA